MSLLFYLVQLICEGKNPTDMILSKRKEKKNSLADI